jgi:hypothetical protein
MLQEPGRGKKDREDLIVPISGKRIFLGMTTRTDSLGEETGKVTFI